MIALVGSVAAFAFAQSYGALTAFARDSDVLAPGLTPLIVDATIGVSTFALVVLGEKPARRARTPRPGDPHREANRDSGPRTRDPEPRHETQLRAEATATAIPDIDASPATALIADGDVTSDLAAELARAKATKQPLEIVHAVLAAHKNGDPLN
ncbi:MAG: hypothetical protein JWP55_4773, partial [Mycobacterium sp.]|nr:hypothetical protein [Mycobacterium sp.]